MNSNDIDISLWSLAQKMELAVGLHIGVGRTLELGDEFQSDEHWN